MAETKEVKKTTTSKPKAATSKSKTTTVKKKTTTKKQTTKKVATEKKVAARPIKKVEIEELKETEKVVVENDADKKDSTPYTPVLIDEQKIDHVAILKKKMEAQKKLNEKNLDNPIAGKPIPRVNVSELLEDENEFVKENRDLADELEKLREQNKELQTQIENLTDDNNLKDERIIILTNSITDKETASNEENEELEKLREENAKLKERLKLEKETQESEIEEVEESVEDKISNDVREKGELLLRIRVLNDCIAEKESALEEVENELNKLSEKDIVAETFTSKIKEIRKERKDSIKFANSDLESLASLVKQAEVKMNAKRELYNEKCKELENFEREFLSKKLNYTEKENELKIKSKLIAEKDAFYVDIDGLEVSYRKLVSRYKNRLVQAEERMKVLNDAESALINKYLTELKEAKIKQNEDYLLQKEEKDALLAELESLSSKLQVEEKEDLSLESFDIDTLNQSYASTLGKISLVNDKLKERKHIESLLLQNEEIIRKYYDAFRKREIAVLNINENKQRLVTLANDDMQAEKKMRLEILIEDDEEKVEYFTKIIKETEKNEKTIYYIRLINSISELEVALNELKRKEAFLKSKIDIVKE